LDDVLLGLVWFGSLPLLATAIVLSISHPVCFDLYAFDVSIPRDDDDDNNNKPTVL
jgi:hypothetical protein